MKKKRRSHDPLSAVVALIDRLVTQAGLTRFQLGVLSRRVDALETLARKAKRASQAPARKAKRR
jgi:hypothetical protein